MFLLNSKSVIDCNEDEYEIHSKENETILDNSLKKEDYDCALICKYQDEYNKKEKQKIYGCKLSEIWNELERFDFKNGCDFYLNEDNNLVIMIYGQGYTYKDTYYLVTMGVLVLPYDVNGTFLDISRLSMNIDETVLPSKNQYDSIKIYH